MGTAAVAAEATTAHYFRRIWINASIVSGEYKIQLVANPFRSIVHLLVTIAAVYLSRFSAISS